MTNKWKHQGNQIYEQIFVSALIEVINNIIIAYCRFKDNWFDHCLSACNYCDYNGRELVLYRLLQREIHLTTDINFGGKGKGIADLKLKRWNHKLIRLLKIRNWQKKVKTYILSIWNLNFSVSFKKYLFRSNIIAKVKFVWLYYLVYKFISLARTRWAIF